MIKDVLIIIFVIMDFIYIHQLEKKINALQSWVEFLLKKANEERGRQ